MMRAGDDLLHPVGQALLGAADLDDRHHRGAEQGAEHGAASAGQAAAADDHGGDHVELEAVGDGRIADRQPRELQHAGEAGERRGRACRR